MIRTYGDVQQSLEKFLEHHLDGLENNERIEALIWYCQGLGLELPQKSVLGIGSKLSPQSPQACRQRIQRAVRSGRFVHHEVFHRLQSTVFDERKNRFDGYCLDDTGFAKKGDQSVGVQRQYSGTLGKIGNCQVLVTLHAAADDFSACLDGQLYMPESWIEDRERCTSAEVPDKIGFQTKPEIALELLKSAKANGAPLVPVVMDAGFGDSRELRDGIKELGFDYVAAISSNTTFWPPNAKPKRPKPHGKRKRGRPKTVDRDATGIEPVRVARIAVQAWEEGRFQRVLWREGSQGKLSGVFCALRVQSAEKRHKGQTATEPLWLLIEKDTSEITGFKYYVSSLPPGTKLKELVQLAKLRWRIERDYQDMKQKLGLNRYEGRKWGGFHRHFAMVALMHAFISLHRHFFSCACEICGQETLDVAGLSSRAHSGFGSLDRPLPHLSAAI